MSDIDDQVAAFSPRYQVIRYDARGFHKSTGAADRTADPDDLRILAGVPLYLGAITALAFGVGLIVRSSAAGMSRNRRLFCP